MFLISTIDDIYQTDPLPKYVLGYGIDRQKLNQLILKKAPDIDPSLINDTADKVIAQLLDDVDNDQHWIAVGRLNGDSFVIISFGQEAFGDDYEELKQKDFRPIECLNAWQSIICGPSNFVRFDRDI